MITLTGRLICADHAEAEIVRRHLDRHSELTRAEPGCLHFCVAETDDPLVWEVSERFVDRPAFDAHQHRVRASEWGRVTAGIARDYAISETKPAAVEVIRAAPLGTRMTVRTRIEGGYTDALGYLRDRSDTHCVIETRRGLVEVALDDVHLAKEVPPPPAPRAPRIQRTEP